MKNLFLLWKIQRSWWFEGFSLIYNTGYQKWYFNQKYHLKIELAQARTFNQQPHLIKLVKHEETLILKF
jgi:hypothetical protein